MMNKWYKRLWAPALFLAVWAIVPHLFSMEIAFPIALAAWMAFSASVIYVMVGNE